MMYCQPIRSGTLSAKRGSRGDTVRNKRNEDIWELAINGKSWPNTERLRYNVGDGAKWRLINVGYLPHPMHMHGFYFRLSSKGTGSSDAVYATGAMVHLGALRG